MTKTFYYWFYSFIWALFFISNQNDQYIFNENQLQILNIIEK